MSTDKDTNQAATLANLIVEVSQTLGGYSRHAASLALQANIDDAAWARQAQAMIDAERMRILKAFSPEALAAIASGELSMAYIVGGLRTL